MSRTGVQRLVNMYRLVPFRYGVYLVAGVPRTEWQPLMAACLAGGPFVAASHRSAALLHEFPAVARPPAPEITVFGDGSLRMTDVVRHRSDLLHPDDLSSRRGIPTTSPARTVIDLGRYLSEFMLIRCLDHAKRRGLCSYEDVAACLERIAGPGRRGTRWLRAALERRAGGVDAGDSHLEVRVAEAFAAAGLPSYIQQHRVEVGGHTYFIDFAWPESRVGVEVKGEIHLDPSVADGDVDRENLLVQAGWRLFDARPITNLTRLAGLVGSAIARSRRR